jgi:hypothetical protein
MAFGTYRVYASVATVTTAKTLLYLTVPADSIVRILRASITCEDEDTSEQILAELNRIASLGTPTATATTPKPTAEGMAASGTAGFRNVTADEPTYDSAQESIARHGSNKLAGWEYVPLVEERVVLKPGENVGLRLIDDIANAADLSAEIVFEELG